MIDFNKIRKNSQRILKEHKIPYNQNIPYLDLSEFQDNDMIARRLIILYALNGLANNADPELLKNWLIQENLWKDVNENEKTHFDGHNFSTEEENELSWRQESLNLLCWAGGIIDNLELPYKECDLESVFLNIPPEISANNFVKNFSVRKSVDIWSQTDLHYCIHAALRHPEIWEENTSLDKLRYEIVLERRQALEWMVDKSKSWDDISLDT